VVAEHRLSALLRRQAEIRELVRQVLSFPETKAGERLPRTRLAAPAKSAMARLARAAWINRDDAPRPLGSEPFLPRSRNRS